MAQTLPPTGGVTLTSPTAQPTITAYTIDQLVLNVTDGTGFLGWRALDANGNTLASGSATLTHTQVNAIAANVKALVYSHLQALLGISGTVS